MVIYYIPYKKIPLNSSQLATSRVIPSKATRVTVTYIAPVPARSRQVQHIIPEKKGIIKYTYGGTKTSPRLYTYDIPHSQHHYQKSTK